MNGQTPHSPAEAIHLGVSLVRQELIQAVDLDVGVQRHARPRAAPLRHHRSRRALSAGGQGAGARGRRHRSAHAARVAVAGAEAARGDRARAVAEREGAAARRADGDADRERRGPPVRPAAGSPQAGARDGLHLASAAPRSSRSPTASSACATGRRSPRSRRRRPRAGTWSSSSPARAASTRPTSRRRPRCSRRCCSRCAAV